MNRLLPVALLLVAAAAAYLVFAPTPGSEDGSRTGVSDASAEGDRLDAGSLEGSGAGGEGDAEGAPAVERDVTGDGTGAAAAAAAGQARVQVRFLDPEGRPVRALEARVTAGDGFAGMVFRMGFEERDAEDPGVTPDANGVALIDAPTGDSLTLRTRGDYWAAVEIPLQALRPGETLDIGNRTLTPAARVHGVVKGADGTPLEGAQVSLRSESGFGFGPDLDALRATTDVDGRYAIGGVRSGSYVFDVDGPGHARESLPGYLVPAGGGDLQEDFHLQPGLSAFGLVVDQDRNPVEGAEIRVQRGGFGYFMVSGPDGKPRTPAGAVTAADGRFSLAGLPAEGGARVLATAEGYAPTSEPFAGEEDEMVIEMRRQVRFAGTLLDPDGRPAPGIEVSLRPQSREDWSFWLRDHRATTDAEGRFAFSDVEPGLYRVEASTPTASLSGTQQQLDVDAPDAQLRMRSVPVLVVQVSDEAGAPVTEARVSVRPQQPRSSGTFTLRGEVGDSMLESLDGSQMAVGGSMRTDEQGRAWFPELGEGIYDLTVRADGKAEVRRPLTRGRGPQTEDVMLLPGADLRVRIVDGEGRPVEGVNAILQDLAGDGPERTRRSDVAGRAWWDGLSPGRYAVRAEAGTRDGAMVLQMFGAEEEAAPEPRGEIVEIAAGQHADLVLTVENLAMPEVLVMRDGKPVAGAEARLEPAAQKDGGIALGNTLFMQGNGPLTGPDGRVRLTPVEPGEYTLWVRPTPGSPESEKSVSVPAGSSELLFEVQGGTLTGRIVGMQGALEGVRVSLERHGAGEANSNQVMIFSVSYSGPGGDVMAMSGGSPMASVRTDAEGRYTFPDVPAGDWVVVARARNYTEWRSEPLTVAGNGSVDAGVGRMEAGGRIEGRVSGTEASGGAWAVALITLRSEEPGVHEVTIPRDGRYAFDDIKPGRYILEFQDEESTVLEVKSGRTVTWNW